MPEAKPTQAPQERLFLVFVNSDEDEDQHVELELEGLVEAAGGVVVGMTRQRLAKPHKRGYIGSGKVDEVKLYAEELSETLQALVGRWIESLCLDFASAVPEA